MCDIFVGNSLKTSFRLVETLAGAHGALDVERADVLPVLLQQRDQEIDGQTDVGGQVIRLHGHVANGNGQAKDLVKKDERAKTVVVNVVS